MKLDKVIELVGNIPVMTSSQGEFVYNLILNNDISEVLELGFAHGTSSCYMAAALSEKGAGQVVTIDNTSALKRVPALSDLLEKTQLHAYIKPIYAQTTYNWELMRLIEQNTRDGQCIPVFDLCYLDGAHNFEVDACAFFLIDKLLKPGGFIIFDDVYWSYAISPSLKDTDWVKALAPDEREVPHVAQIVDLLVKQHPHYEGQYVLDDWYLARKIGGDTPLKPAVVETSLAQDARYLLRKGLRKLKGEK